MNLNSTGQGADPRIGRTSTKGKRRRRSNGEGSIKHRPDGTWEARLSLGAGQRKSIYGKTQEEVRRKLIKLQHDQINGVSIVADERLTVSTYLTNWVERKATGVDPSTHRGYVQALAHVIRAFGSLRLTKLTAMHLADLYAQLQRGPRSESNTNSIGRSPKASNSHDEHEPAKRMAEPKRRTWRPLSPTTVRLIHVTIRQALDDAVKLDLLTINVADRVDAPRARRPIIEPLTQEEAQRLLTTAHAQRLEALYVLAVTTGLRLGELLGLRWRFVDLGRETLQVTSTLRRANRLLGEQGEKWELADPKTPHSRRKVALSRMAVDALRSHRAQQAIERLRAGAMWVERDLVFCDEVGDFLSGTYIERYPYQRLLAEAGLPHKRFHDLRHTAATLLLKAGTHPKVVQEMLGHSTIGITLDLYSHTLPDMQRDAATGIETLLRSEPPQAGNEAGAS